MYHLCKKNQCLLRLAPLRVLAHRGLVVGIPVLRMFYISVIRSLIDYAAPVLVRFSDSHLRSLERIQNEAMRIILGCPKTAKIEVLRAELSLPSVVCRIHEITCRGLCRMAQRGSVQPLRALAALSASARAPANRYLRQLLKVLTRLNIVHLYFNIVPVNDSPSWRPHNVSVTMECLNPPKSLWYPHELRAHFMEQISTYPLVHAVHIYCDGSIDGSKSGCGVFIRSYNSPHDYTDLEISKRLPDHLSSTRAELYAILEGLRVVCPFGKDVFFFVDSQGALYELLSASPCDWDIVQQCLHAIDSLERDKHRVHFTWVPSHVGIPFNEKADALARCALFIPVEGPPEEYTFSFVKGKLRLNTHGTIDSDIVTSYERGSPSSIHYVHVSQATEYPYGRRSALCDLVVMRLRLGYKYYWEVSGAAPESCAVCARPGGHTLRHYVLECPAIASYRPQGINDVPSLVTWFIDHNIVPDIVKEHPQFAPRW